MISPRSSAERNSTFLVSNRSKQTLRHLISSTASPVASQISSKSMFAYGDETTLDGRKVKSTYKRVGNTLVQTEVWNGKTVTYGALVAKRKYKRV